MSRSLSAYRSKDSGKGDYFSEEDEMNLMPTSERGVSSMFPAMLMSAVMVLLSTEILAPPHVAQDLGEISRQVKAKRAAEQAELAQKKPWYGSVELKHVRKINQQLLTELLKQKTPFYLEVSTTWCKPCRLLKNYVELELPGARDRFYYIEVDVGGAAQEKLLSLLEENLHLPISEQYSFPITYRCYYVPNHWDWERALVGFDEEDARRILK